MYTILWVDDEVDMLKPYILFLKEKGYEVTTAVSGTDALDLIEQQQFDIAFLDENMPGMSGLETLEKIHAMRPHLPVVMITKSEEEDIMEMAIGRKMADYLIKPVNPKQILMTLKKNLHQRQIVGEQVTDNYRQAFNELSNKMSQTSSANDWIEIYRQLITWDLNLDETNNELHSLLHSQIDDANRLFAKFIKQNYQEWISDKSQRPLLSADVMQKRILPLLDEGKKVMVLVLDNFRYDQWRVCQGSISDFFTIQSDEMYFSILPTVTGYARNALFSGLLPIQIKEFYPNLWVDDEDEDGKNLHEQELAQNLLQRFRRKENLSYNKINNSHQCEEMISSLHKLTDTQLNICVVNFVDILSHARTENNTIRELTTDEGAYRDLTKSWIRHSSIYQLFKMLAHKEFTVVLTTDHGSKYVEKPIKVIGDKNTTTCLRYKQGKQLAYNPKEVIECIDPEQFGLPISNISSRYIFATEKNFFAYPNNYNYYVAHYKETFQHGGVSMEEMLVPLITLNPKN